MEALSDSAVSPPGPTSVLRKETPWEHLSNIFLAGRWVGRRAATNSTGCSRSGVIAVDGGLAPRSVIWLSKDDYRGRIRIRLGFQAFDGIWIFHDGEYRWGGLIFSNPDLSLVRRLGEDLLVCRYQLKDLRFQTSGKTSPVKNSNGTNDRFKLPGWQAEPERAGPH